MTAIMTDSAQETARRWVDAGIERSERLARTVSGEGEQAEILTTIRAMIAERDQATDEAARLRSALNVIAYQDAPDEERELDTVAAWLRETARTALIRSALPRRYR
jgi:hypothetical protein